MRWSIAWYWGEYRRKCLAQMLRKCHQLSSSPLSPSSLSSLLLWDSNHTQLCTPSSCIKKKVLSLHLHLCSFISSGNTEKSEYLVGEGFCTSRFMMVVQNYFEDTQTCQQVGQVFCVRLKKGSEKWKLLNFILLIFSKENVFILILFLEMIH